MKFELHITVEPKEAARFFQTCYMVEAKPLYIQLAKGLFQQQPMCSLQFEADTIKDAKEKLNSYIRLMQLSYKHTILRYKLETEFDAALECEYHEAHYSGLMVETCWGSDFVARSRNILSSGLKPPEYDYGTVRHKNPLQFKHLQQKVESFFKFKKSHAETVLIDTNPWLDSGWL